MNIVLFILFAFSGFNVPVDAGPLAYGACQACFASKCPFNIFIDGVQRGRRRGLRRVRLGSIRHTRLGRHPSQSVSARRDDRAGRVHGRLFAAAHRAHALSKGDNS